MTANRTNFVNETLRAALLRGERRALARAITLAESTRADHREDALALVESLPKGQGALRLGLTGTPGVGKSTFIESLGGFLTRQGHKVAVLAVDPSSARSGGSILGDKTRMETLSRDPNAFIRPSPSSGALGGVAARTREAMLLCEAAGYDVIIIETVGVGQSETMVAQMTDVFLLLMAPAGGDELQGVKRGVMEMADMIVVNKADGDLRAAAQRTCADYAGALRLLRRRAGDPPDYPQAVTCSALEGGGVEEVWRRVRALDAFRRETGVLAQRRARQSIDWMRSEIERGLRAAFDAATRDAMPALEQAAASGALTPEAAAQKALRAFLDARAS